MDKSEFDAEPPKGESFDERELDKIVRQIVDKVRGNYYLNGETARGMPSEVKKIIDQNVDRM